MAHGRILSADENSPLIYHRLVVEPSVGCRFSRSALTSWILFISWSCSNAISIRSSPRCYGCVAMLPAAFLPCKDQDPSTSFSRTWPATERSHLRTRGTHQPRGNGHVCPQSRSLSPPRTVLPSMGRPRWDLYLARVAVDKLTSVCPVHLHGERPLV